MGESAELPARRDLAPWTRADLPEPPMPPLWRRLSLVGMALFYGYFVTLVARSFTA